VLGDVVSTFAHGAKGLIGKVFIQLPLPGEPLSSKGHDKICEQLDEMKRYVQSLTESSAKALKGQYPSGGVVEIVSRNVDGFRDWLRDVRNINVELDMPPTAGNMLTQAFPLQEAMREVLANIGRYSESGTVAIVQAYEENHRGIVRITNRSAHPIGAHRLAQLNAGQAVEPESSTQTGEQSSGIGLAGIHEMLSHAGGRIQFHAEGTLMEVTITVPLADSLVQTHATPVQLSALS
jgi:hypothetical protein